MNRAPGIRTRLRLSLLSVAVASCFNVPALLANPVGPQVVNGQVSVASQGGTLSITNSPNAIIHWQSFSIAPNETTRFLQQSASSAVLNRVVGQDPSVLLGALQSNGRVFLVNPTGIVIGQGARIDVAGLVASTLEIRDRDFLAGRLNFEAGAVAGDVRNQGTITTASGGMVYLIGSNIENSGIIRAPDGSALLAAGRSVRLGDSAAPGVGVEFRADDNRAVNLGQMLAQGGSASIYAGLIEQKGIVGADSATRAASGKIVFRASRDATLDAGSRTSANGPGGGSITIESGGTSLALGQVEARGSDGKGGDIRILGERVGVAGNALVDVSGAFGGGTVLVGGGYGGRDSTARNAVATFLGTDAAIRADAGLLGDGGRIVLWGEQTLRAFGTISARGGANAGNGGFVETSARGSLEVSRTPDLTAPKGSGGAWLIDPSNIFLGVVDNLNVTSGPDFTTTGSPALLDVRLIAAALDNDISVSVDTAGPGTAEPGNITLNAAIVTHGGTRERTLTLRAHNDIYLTPTASIQSTGTVLNVTLHSDSDASGAGAIALHPGAVIDTNGGNLVMGGGADPTRDPAQASGDVQQGIAIRGATIRTGAGNISLIGRGSWIDSNVPNPSDADGVWIVQGSAIETTTGNISIQGSSMHHAAARTVSGVTIFDSGTRIGTVSGNITIDGVGPGSLEGTIALSNNEGVTIGGGALVQALNGGAIAITGNAGVATGGSLNGVLIESGGKVIAGGAGSISITGSVGLPGGSSQGNSGVNISGVGSSVESVDGNIVIASSGGAIALAGEIRTAGTGTVTLGAVAGAKQKPGAIATSGLLLTGTGDFVLDQPGNAVEALAAQITDGSLMFVNGGSFAVGSVREVGGIFLSRLETDSSLHASLRSVSGAILLAGDISAPGNVTLQTATGATQLAGAIQSVGLLLLGSGNYVLEGTQNQVGTLAADIADGSLSYASAGNLVVGAVGTTLGIQVLNRSGLMAPNIRVVASGDLDIAQAVRSLGSEGANGATHAGRIELAAGSDGTQSVRAGDLHLLSGELSASFIELNATQGRIEQDPGASILADALATRSGAGTALDGELNSVSMFSAGNSASGDIALNTNGAFVTLGSVSNQASDGGSVRFSNTHVFLSNSTVDASQDLIVTGGTLEAYFGTSTVNAKRVETERLIMSQPFGSSAPTVLTGNAPIEVTGQFQWYGGALASAGVLTTSAGATTNLYRTQGDAVLAGTRTWDNYGFAVFTGEGTSNLVLSAGTQLNNFGGLYLEQHSSGNESSAAILGPGRIVNSGVIAVVAEGTDQLIAAPIENISGSIGVRSGTLTIGTLTLSGGRIDNTVTGIASGGGGIRITDRLDWTGGVIASAADLVVASGARMTATGAPTLEGVLRNESDNATLTDLSLSGAGSLSNAGVLRMSGSIGIGTSFSNSGTIDAATGSPSYVLTIADGARFENTGTLKLRNGTVAVATGTLSNSGSIEVPAGSSGTLRGALTNSGQLVADGSLHLGKDGAAHVNTGTIRLLNGDFTVAQAGGSFSQEGGGISIGTQRTMTVAGPVFAWNAGTINGASGGGSRLDTGAGGVTVGGAGTKSIADLMVLAHSVAIQAGGGFDIGTNGVLSATATTSVSRDATLALLNGGRLNASGDLDVDGQLNLIGGALDQPSGALNNRGVVDIATGLLELTGGGTGVGTYRVGSGALLRFGNGNYAVGSIRGPGGVDIVESAVAVSGGYDIPGTTAVRTGGMLVLDGISQLGTLRVEGGDLTGTGSVTATLLELSNGLCDGTGDLLVTGNFLGGTAGIGSGYRNVLLTRASGDFLVDALFVRENLTLIAGNGALMVNGPLSAGEVNLRGSSITVQGSALDGPGLLAFGEPGSPVPIGEGNGSVSVRGNLNVVTSGAFEVVGAELFAGNAINIDTGSVTVRAGRLSALVDPTVVNINTPGAVLVAGGDGVTATIEGDVINISAASVTVQGGAGSSPYGSSYGAIVALSGNLNIVTPATGSVQLLTGGGPNADGALVAAGTVSIATGSCVGCSILSFNPLASALSEFGIYAGSVSLPAAVGGSTAASFAPDNSIIQATILAQSAAGDLDLLGGGSNEQSNQRRRGIAACSVR